MKLLRLTSLLTVLATVALVVSTREREARPRTIVLVVVDMLRRDRLSCYGGATPTPNIDRLASRGVRVDDAVASYHQTSMSMAAIFTGLTPSLESDAPPRPLPWTGETWCGLVRFADPSREDRCVPDSVPTLAGALRSAGYATVGVASNPLTFDPSGYSRGFDEWRQVEGSGGGPRCKRPACPLASSVNLGVQLALAGRHARDRLFLYVHYMDVHDHALRGLTYDQAVAVVDQGVGRLVELLAAAGRLDDAVVVLTADHGQSLGERHAVPGLDGHMGNPSFEPVLRVPLIVAGAKRLPPLPRAIRGEDLPDFLTALAGSAMPRERILRPEEVFLSEASCQTYRDGEWKSTWSRSGGAAALFHLGEDPGETRNVAAENPEVLLAHRARIDEIVARLGTDRRPADRVSPADQERLRALGYLR